MNCRLLLCALTAVAGVACRSNAIKVAQSDGGAADLVRGTDVVAPNSDLAVGPDTVDAVVTREVPGPGPDGKASDAVVAEDGAQDGTPLPPPDAVDGSPQLLPEVASDLPADLTPDGSPDLIADVGGDLAVSVPTLPKDVTVYTSKDYGPADAQCVAATPGWLSLVATFLAEDQKCWADSDCMYVSFSDNCGLVCVLPMNRQRVGEFGAQVYKYASVDCSTCPRSVTYPTCTPPTTVYCNAGRCEYKKN